MTRLSKALPIPALLGLLVAQTACTPNQIDQVIADLQIGVDAASVAAPLVLSVFAPAVAAPVTAYLGLADQVFAQIAKLAASQLSAQQKAASIASALATLIGQDPAQILPPNSPPQLVAEVASVANAARAVAGLFPSAATSAHKRLSSVPFVSPQLSASQVAHLAAIQVQAAAQANQASLSSR
jgi:hypothetical protein